MTEGKSRVYKCTTISERLANGPKLPLGKTTASESYASKA
jgi:hypothetical protein